MYQAARAIIIENGRVLVMFRDKHGSQYYTLVGGLSVPGETLEQTLSREVREETGLQITEARLVFIEEHPEPYNQQYIYLCQVAPHQEVAIQDASEEAFMNRIKANVHEPVWADQATFARLAFRTPQLQLAIADGLKNGFPPSPVKLA